jgi:DNA-binding HxlR family transcriptional regulator
MAASKILIGRGTGSAAIAPHIGTSTTSLGAKVMSAQSSFVQRDDDVLMVRPGKWTLTIVTLLRVETLRFNELKRHANGISQKTLTITLRELERDGFITRTMYATIPPRVDYELTDLGRELVDLADGLRLFADRNRERVLAARERFDASGGEPVIRLIHPE